MGFEIFSNISESEFFPYGLIILVILTIQLLYYLSKRKKKREVILLVESNKNCHIIDDLFVRFGCSMIHFYIKGTTKTGKYNRFLSDSTTFSINFAEKYRFYCDSGVWYIETDDTKFKMVEQGYC